MDSLKSIVAGLVETFSKPQQKFLMTLMTTLFVVCGRVNYTNLSRYSQINERTYRRHFEAGLGLERLNRRLIEQLRPEDSEQIVVVDCTFNEKSGRHTHGLDWFYNSKAQRAEKGLEWSVVAIVDLQQKTGYTLSAQQTEADLRTEKTPTEDQVASRSRLDFYLGHLAYCTIFFPDWIRYVVADGFYSKSKWVNGVVGLGFEAIGRLRSDANLKFLYDGPHRGRGRPRRYDGKVDLTDPSRLTFVATLDEGVSLYTAVVWSVNFRRPVRLAYLLKEQNGRRSYVVLFSTDVTLDPLHLYRCYTARFQIEFIFRDARQFLGFSDCEARSAEALDSHVNASLLALNLAKATLQSTHTRAEPLSFSIASLKRLALNEHLFDLFIDSFDLDPTLIKSHPNYSELLSYGALAS